jgi:predicted protein tyrosine phosphatase
MKIEISSLNGLKGAIKRCRPGYIISIADPDSEESIEAKSILAQAPCLYARLNFHDIEAPAPGCRMPAKDIIASTLVMLDRVNIGDQPLLIQCNAGISRSPAVALLAKCHIEMQRDDFTPEDARALVGQMNETFGPISPNLEVMRIGAELLGEHGRTMLDEVVGLREHQAEEEADPEEIW